MAPATNDSAQLTAAVFQTYGEELHRYLIRHLSRKQDARDLAQEVYLRLLRLEKSELVRQPNAYLFFVAAQVVSQFNMRNQADPIIYDSEIARDHMENPVYSRPGDLSDTLHTERQLEHLLTQLPPTHRDVLLLRKRDGLSWAEIAQELDLSVHTVKKYVREARVKLRLLCADQQA